MGITGCGVEPTGETAVEDVARAGTSGASVAALPRPRQRRWHLPNAAEVSAGTGKVHETVKIRCLAAWLNTMRAFKLLARHQSYSAVKSEAMTAGCCDGHEVFTAPFSSNHAGPHGGAWQAVGAGWVSWHPAGTASSLQHLRWGRRDGGGPSRVTILHPVYLPQHRGGREVAGRVSGWKREKLPRRGLAAN